MFCVYKFTVGSSMYLRHCTAPIMACYADINLSQCSVAVTYARCGGIFNVRLTANLPKNLTVKKISKSVIGLRFDKMMVLSLWPVF